MANSSGDRGDQTILPQFMSAWQLRDYGGLDSLEFVTNIPVPRIVSSKDVLVEVKAASVNVLDPWMPGQYKNILEKKFDLPKSLCS